MTYIVSSEETSPLDGLGGKIQALGALAQADLAIPSWIALRPQAFYDSLTPDQRAALDAAQSPEALGPILEALEVNPAVAQALSEHLKRLCPDGQRLAVRSSAADEDSPKDSFAGQLESFLFVAADVASVCEKVVAVWGSGFSQRVWAYRQERGLRPLPAAPAVLIQRMVDAEAAGVAFSADPVSGRRGVTVVAAVVGLGDALVSGESDSDVFYVDRDGHIISREIAHKPLAQRFDPVTGTLALRPVPEADTDRPALDDAQVRAVAALARRSARHVGLPQDIEWATEGNRLYLLQSRPITSLVQLADPDAQLTIWDNSNIAESYGGVTTPLTFSFARKAYEEVYRQFCLILRVPRHVIQDNDDVFARMLGLIEGRVYYNLLSWYRVLAMLPGFKTNRAFMEQMMGVKETVPEELLPHSEPATWSERWADRLRLGRSVLGLVGGHFSLKRRIRDFYARLEAALGSQRPDLSAWRPDELVAYYRNLERQLLTRWDAPLLNDFFAMIFYGTLRKLCQRWCDDEMGSLQNNLLLGEGGMISAEPAARMQEMAQAAKKHPNLIATLQSGRLAQIRKEINQAPEFKTQFDAYLEKFGDRCLDELKLESQNLLDDPLPVLRAVGQLARGGGRPARIVDSGLRAEAEAQVRQRLRNPLKWWVFRWVLGHARTRVRDRENLRFERTRVFGRVRMIFSELGRRDHALDLLENPRDVFYLEVEEVLGAVEGTLSAPDFKGLAALRRTQFERFLQQEPPADRFQTRGVVYQGNLFSEGERSVDGDSEDENVRTGLGCCPGVVRGRVRVIHDPRDALLEPGIILVAERTDPSWIMLFPFAAGVLVERGSLLSHAAIVSRELGIPSIVSVPAVTRWLRDGDCVELDGSTGVVRKLEGGCDRAE